jgi:lipooligosaccharide transport system permease protein
VTTATIEPTAPDRRWVTPLWLRALGYFAYAYKKTWRSSITTSFLFPILYLAAMGVGLGKLVKGPVSGVSYLDFIGPGLLASTTMQIGANEAMYPVMAAIKWMRTYYAMLATPLRVTDVVRGHLGWIAVRVFTVSIIYVAVIAAFGIAHSPLAILAVPAGVLTGVAFAAPIAAFAATRDKDSAFITIYRFGLIPLFLFSGTFFPIAVLPGWLHVIAAVTPLYHGVALCRGLVLGHLGAWEGIGHAAYLVALLALGVRLAMTTYRRRLVT